MHPNVLFTSQYALQNRLQHWIMCQLSRSETYLTVVAWREHSRADLGKTLAFFHYRCSKTDHLKHPFVPRYFPTHLWHT